MKMWKNIQNKITLTNFIQRSYKFTKYLLFDVWYRTGTKEEILVILVMVPYGTVPVPYYWFCIF